MGVRNPHVRLVADSGGCPLWQHWTFGLMDLRGQRVHCLLPLIDGGYCLLHTVGRPALHPLLSGAGVGGGGPFLGMLLVVRAQTSVT